MPTWFWMLFALGQTIAAGLLWEDWARFNDLASQYPPEVLAATHFAIPPGLLPNAWFASAVAVGLWARAIWSAEP